MDERKMMDKLAEAASDLGCIARLARLVSDGLREVADALEPAGPYDPCDRAQALVFEWRCARLASEAVSVRRSIELTLAKPPVESGAKPADGAAKEGDVE